MVRGALAWTLALTIAIPSSQLRMHVASLSCS